ncbi:MAG: ROK family protein [Pseudomonadota bacterium]
MILCFDIGGSRIKAALAQGGSLVPLGEAPTPTDSFEAFAATLASFQAGRPVRGIAISVAGVVDPASGRITVVNIPCAHGRSLGPDLAAALGLPVLVLNDADCFALAEARQGAGRGHDCVFGIILGTGVGGGVVINGQVLTGAAGYAGEWGHGPIVREADLQLACGCGQMGCLDTIGGARGIERLHLIREGQGTGSVALLAAWRAGDAAAGRTVGLWLDLLAGPLAMVVNVLGASVVPVGGGLSNAPDLVAALDAAVRARILRHAPQGLLVPATCGPDAGLIGAAEAGALAFPC